MMRRVAPHLAALAVAWSQAVRAEPLPLPAPRSKPNAAVSDAQSHFRRGLELYEEGNLAAAVAEMKRAYQIAPNFRVLYDVGQIHFEMQNYSAALAAFERYLEEGNKEVPADRRRQVERDIAKLKQRLALVEVVVNVPDVEIWIDDEMVGKAPLAAPVVANAGRRKISADKAGYASAQRVVDLVGGDSSKIVFELVEERGAQSPVRVEALRPVETARAEPPRADASPAPPPRPPSNSAWIGWTATGALGAASGVLAILTWRASNDLEDERKRFGATSDGLNEKRTTVRRLALAADIGLAATAGVAGVSLVWTFSSSSRRPPEAARLRLTLSSRSVDLGGAF